MQFIGDRKFDGTRERAVALVLDHVFGYAGRNRFFITGGARNMEDVVRRIVDAVDADDARAEGQEPVDCSGCSICGGKDEVTERPSRNSRLIFGVHSIARLCRKCHENVGNFRED